MKAYKIFELMLMRYGISKKEESAPILIKARKLMKQQNLSKWDAVDKVIEDTKKEKGRINFFRPDFINSDNTSCNSSFNEENPNLMFVNIIIA
jgi:hypothetical protein